MGTVELKANGLHLTGTRLWLDAHRKSELSFVSHAHADHIARHERVIATSSTVRLMTHRLGQVEGALSVPYNRPFDLGPLRIELLPAGHILGSAQIRITRIDGRRIVYTGDLNVFPSLTAEPAQVAECDTLIIESTFGHPKYRFPPKEEVFEKIAAWVRYKLERGVTPVLLGYALGKSQEIIKFLTSQRFEVSAHASVFELVEVYRELGVTLPEVRRFGGAVKSGEVLVFPPHLSHSPSLCRIWPRSTAVLTGWAVDSLASRRYSADVAFPLSDHADFEALKTYVKKTGAKEVMTHHGFAQEFARALREEGIDARAVGHPQQLRLL